MRNPLKRNPDAKPKPTLRERLAATKEKYARTLAVHRALNAPPPEPAVDRVALVNYASWLFMERRMVCRELYPHMGVKAENFVLSLSAADRFHFPTSGEFMSGEPSAWKASARAVPVLDLVGVDWRSDLNESGCKHLDHPSRQDTGERPSVPHGWPRLDAALLDALDDLNRLDAAQVAMGEVGPADRDVDTVPGYESLEDARNDALDRLGKLDADSLIGLQAKAKALLTRSVSDLPTEHFRDIAESLARDLLGATNCTIEPQPDPIYAAIEETKRLDAARDAALLLPQLPGNVDPPEQTKTLDTFFAHINDVLLVTPPRTAAGCAALCRYALAYQEANGVALDETPDNCEHYRILDLIARSPLL